MKHQPDGTWRSAKEPVVVSPVVLRARWLESETIRLKNMGLSFEAIAEQITRVGRGQAQPIVALPEGLGFASDYKISRQAVHKAFRRAISREPALAADELRRLDHARSEHMFMNLQPAIRKGNTRAIEVGLKLLDHTARINGYIAPARVEVSGKNGGALTIETFRRLCEEAESAEVENKE